MLYIDLQNLIEETTNYICINFKDSDPFYPKATRDIVEGFILYLEPIYGSKLTKVVIVQELFDLLSKTDFDCNKLWVEIKESTGFNPISINALTEQTLNDLFSYINSAIKSGLYLGTIIKNENR